MAVVRRVIAGRHCGGVDDRAVSAALIRGARQAGHSFEKAQSQLPQSKLRASNKMKLERPPTDQRASQRHQRFVDLWPPLIPDSQSAELMQPADGSLNHPAKHAQPTAMLGVAFSQHRFNPSQPQRLAMRLRLRIGHRLVQQCGGMRTPHCCKMVSELTPASMLPGFAVMVDAALVSAACDILVAPAKLAARVCNLVRV